MLNTAFVYGVFYLRQRQRLFSRYVFVYQDNSLLSMNVFMNLFRWGAVGDKQETIIF